MSDLEGAAICVLPYYLSFHQVTVTLFVPEPFVLHSECGRKERECGNLLEIQSDEIATVRCNVKVGNNWEDELIFTQHNQHVARHPFIITKLHKIWLLAVP